MFSTKHKGIKQHYKIASKCWKRITLIKLKSYCKAYLEVNVIKQQHDEKNNTVKVKHYRNNIIIKLSINYSQLKLNYYYYYFLQINYCIFNIMAACLYIYEKTY